MSEERLDNYHIVARITLGAVPNLCMILILATIMLYFWGQYRVNARLALMQGSAIDAAIVEGRAFHHREGRLMRRIAIQIGIPADEVEAIVPESSLDFRRHDEQDGVKPVWLAF